MTTAYFARAACWAALWWVVFGLEFGDWLGWENPAYAIGIALVLAFLEVRLGRAAYAALTRRFTRPPTAT